MTAQQSVDTSPQAHPGRASPPGGRRRLAVRWVLHGVLFVVLAAGVFGLLYLRVRLRSAKAQGSGKVITGSCSKKN